jgi:pyruvate dehydrogenase E2 component (dihydrolipoamide acetyltransferase)
VATNILMPALSPTMTEGTLARWLKKEGETIKAGDVIAEIETDKATMEVEAVDEGVLGRILVQDGTEGVKVNAPIAVLVDAGEAVPSAAAPTPAPAAKSVTPAPSVQGRDPGTCRGTRTGPVSAAPNGHAVDGERIFASPLARRMASQAGIDLSTLKGSGPNGRIVRADIEAAQKGAPPGQPLRPQSPRRCRPRAHRYPPRRSVRRTSSCRTVRCGKSSLAV